MRRGSNGLRRLLMRRPIIRMADPSHYTPGHRIWECKEVDKPKRRGALLEAWLKGEVGSEELLKIIRIELERK
ncbi:MAG: hypothetical protein L2C94_002215 [Aigarchaeota archaeon]|nr:hypothetical protein [Candidatus Wolframiiraptor gerlachensis]